MWRIFHFGECIRSSTGDAILAHDRRDIQLSSILYYESLLTSTSVLSSRCFPVEGIEIFDEAGFRWDIVDDFMETVYIHAIYQVKQLVVSHPWYCERGELEKQPVTHIGFG